MSPARAVLLGFVLYGGPAIGCARQGGPPPELNAEPKKSSPAPAVARPDLTLSLIGLNDLHGRLRALPAFAGYVNNLRRARSADGGAVAVLDAGDMFQGTIESNMTEGASVIAAYRALGMTAATLGNHEFDFGPEGAAVDGDPQGAIRARIAEASFPILCANLVVRGTHDLPNWRKLQRSALLDVGPVRVGLVGLLTRETPSIVRASAFVGLDVEPLAPALAREARALRARGAEVVVALAHAGASCSDFTDPSDIKSCSSDAEIFDVARALPEGLVDAIFAGHSHAGVAQFINGIPIVEAYAYGRAFSRIDLRLAGSTHHVLEHRIFPPHPLCPKLGQGGDCELSDYEGAETKDDPALLSAIRPALERARDTCNMPVGCTLSDAFSGGHGEESPLGNLFADLIRESVPGADLAIVNGGSLRANLPAGPIDYGELYEAMPFDNLLAKVHLTGAELKKVLVAHLSHDRHGLISISGLWLEARCGQTGLQVELRRHDGQVVQNEDKLLIATSDYLATGGDGLLVPIHLGADRIEIVPGRNFRDSLASALGRHPHLSPRDPAVFDRAHPRLRLASPRPLQCAP